MRDALLLPWDCVIHSTRHTFCTRLGERGADAFTIQRLAGDRLDPGGQKPIQSA
jgi:integrase